MGADFWLYAFSDTFCKCNAYAREGRDKGDRAGWRTRGNIRVWIFLFHPLPASQWGYKKAGTVWGRGREAKEITWSLLWSCFLSVATSHEALPCCAAATAKGAASGRWPCAVLPGAAPQHQAGGSLSSAHIWWSDQCPGKAFASGSQHFCCMYKSSIYKPMGRWWAALSRAAGKWINHTLGQRQVVYQESRGKCCWALVPFFPIIPCECLHFSHLCLPDNFLW